MCVKLSHSAITDIFVSLLSSPLFSSSLLLPSLLPLLYEQKRFTYCHTVLSFQLEKHSAGNSVGSEICVWACVFIAALCLASRFLLAGSVCPSVFKSIKYLGPIHRLLPRSFSSSYLFLSTSLPPSCCFLCISRPSVALQIHLCGTVCLHVFFPLLGFNYLREAEAPLLFQTHVFIFLSPSLFLSFLVSFTLTPPPPFCLCLCLSWECCYQKWKLTSWK